MQTIQVCKYCGSPNVLRDAYYDINADEYHTYDNCVCEGCGKDSDYLLIAVEVPDDFDIYTDTVDLEALHNS